MLVFLMILYLQQLSSHFYLLLYSSVYNCSIIHLSSLVKLLRSTTCLFLLETGMYVKFVLKVTEITIRQGELKRNRETRKQWGGFTDYKLSQKMNRCHHQRSIKILQKSQYVHTIALHSEIVIRSWKSHIRSLPRKGL